MSGIIKRLLGWSVKKKETKTTNDIKERANNTLKTTQVEEPIQYVQPPHVKKEMKTITDKTERTNNPPKTTQVKESEYSIQPPQIKNTNLTKKWKTVRIYISSTFHDMRAERDHLVKVVFPELRERCVKRQLHLIDVDLRWGVTAEESEQGKVLGLILDEIERSRPFFIGILGERYGSIPDKVPDDDKFAHPWLEDYPDHSYTALEIVYGVLNNQELAKRSFFYLRDSQFISKIPENMRGEFITENPEAAKKLAALKDKIRSSGIPVMENYPCHWDDVKENVVDLDVFGQRILEDLWIAICVEYPEDALEADPLIIERQMHEAFVEERSHLHIGRAVHAAKLTDYVHSRDRRPVVITGESGCGKSAFLASWYRKYASENPDDFVLAYFIGASPDSTNHYRLLRNMCEELKCRFTLNEEIPQEDQKLSETLAMLLFAASRDRTRIVLVLDALDQLSPLEGTHGLGWLVDYMPEKARLVLSSLEGECLEVLQRLEAEEITLSPLSEDEQRQIMKVLLGEWRHKLDDSHIKALLAHPGVKNPLYLRVALEELRLFGNFEQLTGKIVGMAEDIPGLFDQVLARLEEDHGNELVTEAFSLLGCSRYGLSEKEMLELLQRDGEEQFPRTLWVRLARSANAYLVQRGKFISFFHSQLTDAVAARYLSHENRHEKLADYFGHAPLERRLDEYPYQLQLAEQWKALATALSDLDFFSYAIVHDRKYEWMGYWRLLKSLFEPDLSYLSAHRPMVFHIPDTWFEPDICYLKAIEAREKINGKTQEVDMLLDIIGLFLYEMALYPSARVFFDIVREIKEKALGPDHPDIAAPINNLAEVYRAQGKYSEAEPLCRRVLEIREKALGSNHPDTARSLNNLAEVYRAQGKYSEAEPLYRRALIIREKALGSDHPDTARSLNNLAELYRALAKYTEAELLFRQTLVIKEKLLGPYHPDTAMSLNNLAALYEAQGKYGEAEPLYRRVVKIADASLGHHYPDTETISEKLALSTKNQIKTVTNKQNRVNSTSKTTQNDVSSPQTKDRQIRVFISSTFSDMHDERDILVKKIFPQLRKLCEERAVTWTEVDLRWGITKEESDEGKVLPLCLEEIHRCRPYFIGLLGERYGRLPKSISADLLESQPWLKEHLEHSVTELEIIHGVFNEEQMHRHAYFYFRDPKYLESVPEGKRQYFVSDEASGKLVKLKQKIRDARDKEICLLREGYANPEQLGEWILEDFTALIDRLYPKDQIPDPLDQEAMRHEAYAKSRRLAFVGRRDLLRQMDEHSGSSGAKPLVLTGESGCGKSALLAEWAARWRMENPDDLIIQHYTGSTPESADWQGLVRRILSELKRAYNINDELPMQSDALRTAMQDWLVKAAGPRRVVILLDALNQISSEDASAKQLGWLPFALPPNVRLVVSSLPGESLDALQKRNWKELVVPLFGREDIAPVAKAYFDIFSKRLPREILAKIEDTAAAANPLYLRAVLDELRQFGLGKELENKDFRKKLEEEAFNYLKAPDPPALFDRILTRWDEDFGQDDEYPDLVRRSLCLIACSRFGLSEVELLDLLGKKNADGKYEPLPRRPWTPFYLAAENALAQRAGLLNFGHDYLRAAMERRYFADDSAARHFRLQLADYFGHILEPTDRKLDELPALLLDTGQWESLKDLLANLPTFKRLREHRRWKWELHRFWLAIGNVYDPVVVYKRSLAEAERIPSTEHQSYFLNEVAFFLKDAGRYESAEPLYWRAIEVCEGMFDKEHPSTMIIVNNLAELLINKGDYADAEPLLYRAMEGYKRVFGQEHPDTLGIMNNLAVLLYNKGDYEGSEPFYRHALEVRERVLGREHPDTLESVNNFGFLQYKKGDYEGAELLFRRALEACERVLGREHPYTLGSMNNLATLFLSRGDYESAEPLIHYLQKAKERVLGKDHPDTLTSVNNLAVLLKIKGDFDGAEMNLRSLLEAYERVLGREHPDTLNSVNNLGCLLMSKNDYESAEPLLHRALEGICKISGKTRSVHPYSNTFIISYIDILKKMGMNGAQIREKLEEVLKPFGFNVDDFI